MSFCMNDAPEPLPNLAIEILYKNLAEHGDAICSGAGCRFRGIQRAFPEHNVRGALFLFDDLYGSTLALAATEFGLDAVRARLRLSAAKWAAYHARMESDVEF